METRSRENGDGEGYDDVSVIAERVRLGGLGIYFSFWKHLPGFPQHGMGHEVVVTRSQHRSEAGHIQYT